MTKTYSEADLERWVRRYEGQQSLVGGVGNKLHHQTCKKIWRLCEAWAAKIKREYGVDLDEVVNGPWRRRWAEEFEAELPTE